MTRPNVERALLVLIASSAVGCALLYDFEGSGGAGGTTTSSATAAGTRTSSSAPTTAIGATDATADTSTGTGCSPDLCFGGGCDGDVCGLRTIALEGAARNLQINPDTATLAVAVVRKQGDGLGVAVYDAAGLVRDTGPLPNAMPTTDIAFIAHDQDEVLLNEGQATALVHRHDGQSWGPAVSYIQAPPMGTDNHLGSMLSVNGAWFAVSRNAIVTMTPTSNPSWGFAKTPVGASLASSLGYGLVRHAPFQYVFSLYDDGPDGCVGVVNLARPVTATCQANLEKASGIASNGTDVVVRSIRIAESKERISRWVPGTAGINLLARLPSKSRRSIGVDRRYVYFDGAPLDGPEIFFRCELTIDGTLAPEQEPRCKQLAQADAANLPAIADVTSQRLDPGGPNERFLVCWAKNDLASCQVTF